MKPTTSKLYLGLRGSIGLGWSTRKTDWKINDPKVSKWAIFVVWLRREKANGNISGTKNSMHWFFPYTLKSTGARETILRSRFHMC